MPQSRNRAKHHQHHHHHPHPATADHRPTRVTRSAAFVLAVIAAIFGLAVAFFTQGPDIFWLLTGAVAGAVIGYAIGHSMDKSIQRK